MSDRDCDNCAHHSEGGCSVWECSFEAKEDDTSGEIKAIQALPPAQPNLQPTCNQLATDTISRQDAIDALKEHRALFCDNTPDTFSKLSYGEKCRVDELDTAISTLVNLPSAQPEQQWIPCSEKLPKKEELRYWVCTDTGYQCQCRWTNDVYGFGASDRWEWKIFDIPQYQKVVAWMSLPEPYKERRTDETDYRKE